MRRALAASALVLATGCSDEPAPTPAPQVPTRSAPTPTASSQSPSATSEPQPVRFEAARAMGTVRHLAGAIGPRLATGPAFERAAAWVATALERQGYDVRRRPVETPAGRSANVVATAPGFDPGSAYVLVGAHLDTVAVAPGAEDNASGVAVLLELARVLGGTGQVVLVAFGAEEPIGPGDLHHFGSKAYVAAMTAAERRHLRAMVSLDRVGVGTVVPLSSVEGTSSALRDRLAQVARRAGIPTVVETDAASDHESFADARLLAARVGSTPYAGYHSAADVPAVVDSNQLQRVGRLLSTWISGALRAS